MHTYAHTLSQLNGAQSDTTIIFFQQSHVKSTLFGLIAVSLFLLKKCASPISSTSILAPSKRPCCWWSTRKPSPPRCFFQDTDITSNSKWPSTRLLVRNDMFIIQSRTNAERTLLHSPKKLLYEFPLPELQDSTGGRSWAQTNLAGWSICLEWFWKQVQKAYQFSIF